MFVIFAHKKTLKTSKAKMRHGWMQPVCDPGGSLVSGYGVPLPSEDTH